MKTSQFGFAYHMINIIIIVVGVIDYIVSSGPSFQTKETTPSVLTIETIVVTFFTLDYCLKFTLTRRIRLFWGLGFFPIIDLLSIIPYYIERAAQNSGGVGYLFIFRLLRLAKLFQLMKLSIYSKEIAIAVRALTLKFVTVSAGFIGAIVVMILAASALFYAEALLGMSFDPETRLFYYHDGSPTKFQGIPESLWWAIVTMTTVGYGDFFPITSLGKVIAGVSAVSGILVLSFPLAILSNAYSEESTREQTKQSIEDKIENLKSDSAGHGKWVTEEQAIQEAITEVLLLEQEAKQARNKIIRLEERLSRIENIMWPVFNECKLDHREDYADNLVQVFKSIKESLTPSKLK